MRMVHYFTAIAVLCIPALLAAAITGIANQGGETHLEIGLVTAVLVVGVHTLLILFMIVTGRVLKAAMESRPLGDEFLAELNDFFSNRAAYPASILGAFSIVAAAVLGYSSRGFDLSPMVHMTAGILAVVANIWALQLEWHSLRKNQDLLDRVASALDRLDAEAEARGELPAEPEAPPTPQSMAKSALIVGISAWFPYLYWAVIEHRGDFAKASLHPWIEISILGFLVWLIARGAPDHDPTSP